MMTPVVAETYDEVGVPYYYAVAVVKNKSTIKTLEDLEGKKSCHTGAGKPSSWVVPVGTLLAKKFMTQDTSCNPYVSAGKYFKQSCVPSKSLNHLQQVISLLKYQKQPCTQGPLSSSLEGGRKKTLGTRLH